MTAEIVDLIHDAMESVAVAMADEMEMGVFRALRQPVSMGAAFFDLCRELGVSPPPLVVVAIDGSD